MSATNFNDGDIDLLFKPFSSENDMKLNIMDGEGGTHLYRSHPPLDVPVQFYILT